MEPPAASHQTARRTSPRDPASNEHERSDCRKQVEDEQQRYNWRCEQSLVVALPLN